MVRKQSRGPELTINSCHDESDLSSIGSTSKVRIDLLSLMLIQTDESVQDVVACEGIIITTFVIWKVILHRTDRKLLLESINLVQE